MRIFQSRRSDAKQIAYIVSEANKDVAEQFNLNIKNAPKHPSFYTADWVLSDFERGEQYFLCEDRGIFKGCVAFEQPDQDSAYLNRLSVLPDYRHNGIGASLVRYICEYSQSKNIQSISIGIIAEHKILKKWYVDLGFIAGETKRFDHLPFTVLFMHYTL